ncbi:hypothetical protein [Microbacterium thalassium]|uniref:Putative HNH restriction endonuclease n=1 Tax=Microbacterium thalassium TaxID=362649 RepID=A0A7X0FM13_9MICO|nr:hypothetical protein [Microbacterium thalassium]MBB6389979.1 putative HNH restriction endonuclease [Microbacterium thalassium]GLK24665.1 hypothetical protein GCM10017607_19830 [Microbacterium thalassium]
MSNARRSWILNLYRSEYLRSRVWFARRDRWFREQAATGAALACAACGQGAVKSDLELHHLDYDRVVLEDGRWKAREPHADLVPMHPYCHDLLHRLIERDEVLARHRTRRDASAIALETLRYKLNAAKEAP